MTVILPELLRKKLTDQEQELLLTQLTARAHPCLVLTIEEVASATTDSRIGGSALLSTFERPVDKSGKPMKFIAQLNMATLDLQGISSISAGLLSIFLSDNYRTGQPKDSSWFRIVWQPTFTATPDTVSVDPGYRIIGRRESIFIDQMKLADRALAAELSQWIKARNATALQESYMFADAHPRLDEAKAISAFSANGITYNIARAADACYSHLVEAAKDWRLLWRLTHETSDLLVMIHTQDLNSQSLQKSWLVRY